ncbi:MAG: DUF3987 domain-containing protein [Lachnospiraceae bacterium]|nr:DUF3987 domain-containing protein [Lachnospiraceae bacterium]
MGTNYEYEDEVDILLLCKALLTKWKTIIIITSVCAVIFAIYGLIVSPQKDAKSTNEKDGPVISYEDQVRRYEEQVSEYEKDIADYEAEIETYRQQIKEVEEDRDGLQEDREEVYREKVAMDEYGDSLTILTIDPYNVTKQRRTYLVSNDYQIMPGMLYQEKDPIGDILRAYISYIEMANIDLNESLGGVSLFNTSINGNNIVIDVMGKDEEHTDELMNNAVKAIEESKQKINKDVGEHEITLLGNKTYVTVDLNLKNAQEVYDNAIEDKLKAINDKKNSFNNQINSLNTSIHNTRANIIKQKNEIYDLEEPSEEDEVKERKTASLTGILKKLILGILVGLFVSCGFFAFRYITSGTIKSNDEMERRYGIRVLGSYKDPSEISVSAALVCSLMKKEKDIVIAGSVGRETCSHFAEALKENDPELNVYIAGDISKDVEGANIINSAKKAVIIEKSDASLIKDISHEVDVIKGLDIEILGCIMG